MRVVAQGLHPRERVDVERWPGIIGIDPFRRDSLPGRRARRSTTELLRTIRRARDVRAFDRLGDRFAVHRRVVHGGDTLVARLRRDRVLELREACGVAELRLARLPGNGPHLGHDGLRLDLDARHAKRRIGIDRLDGFVSDHARTVPAARLA